MYSFAQRSDIKVVDEPFYTYYLIKTGLDHPGREEIIASMSINPDEILNDIQKLSESHVNVFLKNMAHHHEGLDWGYLTDMVNIFLIRDPRKLIASFAQVIPNPTMQDIGLKHEAELLDYVIEYGKHSPIVIDSNDILPDPQKGLEKLCQKINIPFDAKMLSWEAGPIAEDGVWAKYWYKNVHSSTGFTRQKTSDRPLPDHCKPLYLEALPYYEKLKSYI